MENTKRRLGLGDSVLVTGSSLYGRVGVRMMTHSNQQHARRHVAIQKNASILWIFLAFLLHTPSEKDPIADQLSFFWILDSNPKRRRFQLIYRKEASRALV